MSLTALEVIFAVPFSNLVVVRKEFPLVTMLHRLPAVWKASGR